MIWIILQASRRVLTAMIMIWINDPKQGRCDACRRTIGIVLGTFSVQIRHGARACKVAAGGGVV